MAAWCKELTHLKWPWCLKRLKAGGERDDRGWDGWMASPTRWTWVWISCRSWWWQGSLVCCSPWGRKELRHNWVTELNWIKVLSLFTVNIIINLLGLMLSTCVFVLFSFNDLFYSFLFYISSPKSNIFSIPFCLCYWL